MQAVSHTSPIPFADLSIIEKLPERLIGNVLVQLNKVSGTKELSNIADIPVIMRYASHLGVTSKKMNELVNYYLVTDLFLCSLAGRYQHSPESIANWFNTKGARHWLCKFIQEQTYAVSYQIIQDIYTLALTTLETFKGTPSKDKHEQCFPSFTDDSLITQQGFFLSFNMRSFLFTVHWRVLA